MMTENSVEAAKRRQEERDELLHQLWLLEAKHIKALLETVEPGKLRATSIAAATAFLKLNSTTAAALTSADKPSSLAEVANQLPTFTSDEPVTAETRVDEESKAGAVAVGLTGEDLAEMPAFEPTDVIATPKPKSERFLP